MSQTVPVIRPPPNPLHGRPGGRKLALSIPVSPHSQPNSGGGGLSLNTTGLGGSAQSNGRTPPSLKLNVSAGKSASQFPTLSYLQGLSNISRPNGNIQQVSGPGMDGVVPMDISPQEDISNLDVEQLNDDGWRRVLDSNRIIKLGSLGEGAGGAVTRCMLQGGKTLFALKVITTDPNPEVMKQIRRELAFNKDCSSAWICKYYGAVVDERSATISIAMEYCEGGSLDSVYREVKRLGGRTGEKVLGKIAEGVLQGLTYLSNNRIIHRDIKPSNILICRNGQVKLCDFGVSGELLGSKGDANTFIGTSAYMAPERIQGHSYTITSDVWSLGVTLLEVAQHKFPFPGDGSGGKEGGPAALIELLTYIVTQPIPELKDEPEMGVKWSDEFKYFIACCLEKNTARRANPWRMLEHPWMVTMRTRKVNMERFLAEVWDWKD